MKPGQRATPVATGGRGVGALSPRCGEDGGGSETSAQRGTGRDGRTGGSAGRWPIGPG